MYQVERRIWRSRPVDRNELIDVGHVIHDEAGLAAVFQERGKLGSGDPVRVDHQQGIVCVGSRHRSADLCWGQTAERVNSKANKSISLFVEAGQWPDRHRQDELRFDMGLVQRRVEPMCFEGGSRLLSYVSNTDVPTCATSEFSPAEHQTAISIRHTSRRKQSHVHLAHHRMLEAALPGMRARGSGAIVNISTIGVQIMPAGSGYYAASKAALEGMSGALHSELKPLGISVTVIEPGAFRTDFAGRSLTQSSTVIDDYADTAGKRRKEHDTMHGTQSGDPAKAEKAIIAAIESNEPPAFLLLGKDALSVYRRLAAARLDTIETWEHLTTGTDIDS
jgi:NAD(P)-dependent dehydrogenase (short-subunit alcohol dehydrogenase family)